MDNGLGGRLRRLREAIHGLPLASSARYALLLMLDLHMNPMTLETEVDRETIASEAGRSPRWVSRQWAEAEQMGLLKRGARSHRGYVRRLVHERVLELARENRPDVETLLEDR